MVIATEDPIVSQSTAAAPSGILEQALKALNNRTPGYRRYCDYYDGKQPLTYASEKYRDAFAKMVAEYTENMCPTVVDTIADRLIVTGFGLETQQEQTADTEANVTDAVWQLWRECRMDLRAGEVHQEAVKTGDAYVLVWPDEAGHVQIVPQPAILMTVHYDGDSGLMDWAAKWWLLDNNKARLNLYFADRIEKYVTNNVVRSGSSVPAKASSWSRAGDDVINPYNRIPVFHFANNARASGRFGSSDLKDVLAIQDALNKAVADMLVTMEFAAFPQRWATGMSVKLDAQGNQVAPFEAGVDRLWTATDQDTKFGEFLAANLTQMLAVQDKFLLAIARVSGVPTHYMLLNPSNFPSGESLKTAEARFVSKVLDRQVSFGNVWEDVMAFAAEVQQMSVAGQLSALWKDAAPRSDFDQATTAVLKKQYGVSNEQLQREAGYTEEQIDQMSVETAASNAAALDAAGNAFSRGISAVA